MSTSLQRLDRRAAQCMLDILEAIFINGRSTSEAITEKSGYNIWTVRRAIRLLQYHQCIARIGVKNPLYTLTERGSIALAIWHGRQHRARQRNGTIKVDRGERLPVR